MVVRIKLRFPEIGNLVEDFLKAVAQSVVTIPVSGQYPAGQEVELNVFFPKIEDPQLISATVLSEDPEAKTVQVQITDLAQVQELFDKLLQLEAYKNLIEQPRGPVITIEEVEEGQEPARQEAREFPEPTAEGQAQKEFYAPEEVQEQAKSEAAGQPAVEKKTLKSVAKQEPREMLSDQYAEAKKHAKEYIRIPAAKRKKAETVEKTEAPAEPAKQESVEKPSSQPEEVRKYAKEYIRRPPAEKIRSETVAKTEASAEPGKQDAGEKPSSLSEEVRKYAKEFIRPPDAEKTKPAATEASAAQEPLKAQSEEPTQARVSGPAPTPLGDPIVQLRDWLAVEGKKEKKAAKPKAPPKKIDTKAARLELDPAIIGPANKFAQSMVKAMLRSGYYSPDHPGASQAKQGLYQEFITAAGDNDEFGFMLQHRAGQTTEIFITGITDDPAPLKKVLGIGTFELFYPKYMDYFSRKWLVSFSIKAAISEDHFNKFVDVMSDPSVDKGQASESGRLLTRMLVENQVNEISAIFEDDLISIETELPWRVEMAIQRLAKDLKVLPMFKNVTAAELRRLKEQIVQDILRPLRQPVLLKDIILNAYLISRQVPEINEQELEQAVIENFPLNMLIPASDFIFAEFSKLSQTKAANPREEEILLNRIAAVKRILKEISRRVVEEELEGADEFLEGLFNQQILTYGELPESVQEKINLKRMVGEFKKQPTYWLGKFAEARTKDDMHLFVKFFSKITPGLIGIKDWQGLYLLTDALYKVSPNRLKILAELGAENPVLAVWAGNTASLVKNLLTESSETRKGLEQIVLMLGESGLQSVYRSLIEEDEPIKRKLLLESLIKFGAKSTELLRAILKDPTRPWQLQMLALEALSRAKDKADTDTAKRYLKHSRPELRAEAITAMVRIMGWEAMPALDKLIADPEPAVTKRLMAALGGFAISHEQAKAKLLELIFDEAKSNELRSLAMQEMSRALPESSEQRKKLQEFALDTVSEGEGLGGRLRRGFTGHSEDIEKLKLASLELLGKVGDKTAMEKLSKIRLSGKELSARLAEVLSQLHLRLGK